MKTLPYTYLGPIGTTFSAVAWKHFVKLFGAPDGDEVNCLPAVANGDILKRVMSHHGYGAVAITTKCRGKLRESLDPYADLLLHYSSNDECPFTVIGAVNLKLNFCLMAKSTASITSLKGVLSHEVGLAACKKYIKKHGLEEIKMQTNGLAARAIASEEKYSQFAALGPCEAAEIYDLNILEENVQDKEAFTLFTLVGPKQHKIIHAENNLAIVVFNIPNSPNSLTHVLSLFGSPGLNLSYIHLTHIEDSERYNFLITMEVHRDQIPDFNLAIQLLGEQVTRKFLTFGPFPVIQK
ncbi:MAG: prephenate dehydratase domain-containing protein [Patescibacteria group bacterium]